jgi:hypothetical protein
LSTTTRSGPVQAWSSDPFDRLQWEGRFTLGVGTGQVLNEHVTGAPRLPAAATGASRAG